MDKILIAGAGAMGTIIGALLSQESKKQNIQIDLLDTNQEHIALLNKNGAQITGFLETNIPVNAISPNQLSTQYDLIFSTVKQTVLIHSLKQLLPFMHDQSIVITLQNGIPEDIASELVGPQRVIGGGMEFSGTFIKPGLVELASPKNTLALTIGETDGLISNRLRQVQSLLEPVIPCHITTKLREARFTKLIDNTVASAIPTALGCELGKVFEHNQAIKCIAELGRECSIVLSALDIEPVELFGFHPIPENIYFETQAEQTRVIDYWRKTYQPYHQQIASMLQDIRIGRPCEIEYINGKILHEADKLHIEMPMNQAVIEAINNIQQGKISLKNAWQQLNLLIKHCIFN